MPKGFFKIEREVVSKGGIPKQYLEPGPPYCALCGLNEKVRHPQIGVTGEGRKKIMIIPEAPGETEDILGRNLVGEVGQFVEEELGVLGISLEKDCWTINSVNCRPPGNRTPTKKELQCCRPLLLQSIKELKPDQIWLMGGSAVDTFYMNRFENRTITRWQGRSIPDREWNTYIFPMFHPSFVLRSGKSGIPLKMFRDDLKNASSYLSKPFPEPLDDKVHILYEYDQIINLLTTISIHKPSIVIDYETTGLKPFKPGHKIYVVGIDDYQNSYSFPFQVPDYWRKEQLDEITELWAQILEDPEIKKTAQNLKFEDQWSRIRVEINEVGGWEWCTMITSHILDERQKTSGLKFQAYVRFGVGQYDAEVERYLGGEGEFNEIHKAPLDKLLEYCGFDVKYTRMMKLQQIEEISEGHLKQAQTLFTEGVLTFSDMQITGIPADETHYLEEKVRLDKRITRAETRLLSSDESTLFRKKTGKIININSDKDLRHLFFELLQLKSEKKTKKKQEPSVDEEVLAKLDSSFAQALLRMKKLKKIRDTYLAQFFREIHNGKLHPFFDLNTARTHRSSSSRPNFHNIPVRSEEAKRACRSGIKPTPGCRICEMDYSSQEVRILACYTEDEKLIEYVCDPSTDMHRDQSTYLFKFEQKLVSSDIRFYVKNQWVFPEFYGSWYVSCAKNLWKTVVMEELKTTEGQTVQDHLRSVGIDSFDRFEAHCKQVEDRFWDTYKATKRWQKKVLDSYEKKGYLEMFFGHRRRGVLSQNEIINTPIQGTAFHCLLWTLNRVNYVSKIEAWQTKLFGQIHDSILSNVHPSEQNVSIDTIIQIGTKDIRKEHPWLIVPLEMGVEMTPINGNWYQKKECTFDPLINRWVDSDKNIYDENY